MERGEHPSRLHLVVESEVICRPRRAGRGRGVLLVRQTLGGGRVHGRERLVPERPALAARAGRAGSAGAPTEAGAAGRAGAAGAARQTSTAGSARAASATCS